MRSLAAEGIYSFVLLPNHVKTRTNSTVAYISFTMSRSRIATEEEGEG
jgi:hypothetical protein